MSKFILFIFIFNIKANAATPIPENFQLHVLLPNVSARDLEISHDTKKKSYWISYWKKPGGEKVRKEFTSATIEQLYAGLWKNAPNYASWQSDIDCIRRETWRVEMDAVKKRVCYSPKLSQALAELEKTVALLLR